MVALGKNASRSFRIGGEAWHESWALAYIFDDKADQRQSYLWEVLCRDRHWHVGTGIRSIPGDWKRRARAKRRTQQKHRKDKRCNLAHSTQRGGGSEEQIATEALQDAVHVQVDGGAIAAHVYEIGHKDIKQQSEARPGEPFIRPKAGKYFIRCGGDDAVPQNIKAMVGEAVALDTEGQNCACAVHAVFGAPGKNGKLSVLGARGLARQLLSQATGKAGSSASIHRRLHLLVHTFWEEYMLRHFRGEPTVESHLFWEALRNTAPMVAEESRQKYQQYQGRLQLVQVAKAKVLRESLFFSLRP